MRKKILCLALSCFLAFGGLGYVYADEVNVDSTQVEDNLNHP